MSGLIFAEGIGYGHASRQSMFSNKLGIPIMTFGSGAEYCKMNSLNFIEIPSPYQLVIKDKVNVATGISDLLKFLKPEVLKTIRTHFEDADFVIVDGAFLGLVIAILTNKPHIYVTNDTSTLIGIHGPIEKKVFGSISKRVLEEEKIIVPDFSPPFAITLDNLDPKVDVTFAGPFIEKKVQKPMDKKILSGLSMKKLIEPILGDSVYFANEGLGSYFESSEVVITHGGHTTIMEALSFGKPIIAVVEKAFIERFNNAKRLEQLEVGILIEKDKLTAKTLEAALDYVPSLNKSRLACFRKNFDKYNPFEIVTNHINALKS